MISCPDKELGNGSHSAGEGRSPPPPASMRALFVGLAVTAVGCEGALAYALSQNSIEGTAFLVAHASLCGCAAVATALARRRSQLQAALLHLTLWTAIAGPFGATVALGLGIAGWRPKPANMDIGAWLDLQIPEQRRNRLERLYNASLDGRLRIKGASDVQSFSDVFAEGERQAKFEALSAIGRRFEPTLSNALRLALKDDDASVRVLASTVMAKLQAGFSKRFAALERAASLYRDDPAGWVALAEAHANYGASGLLEAAQARTETGQAAELFERALGLAGDDEPVRLRLAETFLQLGQIQDVIDVLNWRWSDGATRADALRERAEQELRYAAAYAAECSGVIGMTPHRPRLAEQRATLPERAA